MCDQRTFNPRIPGGGNRRCPRLATVTLHCTEKTYAGTHVSQQIRHVCDRCAQVLLSIRQIPPDAPHRPKTYWRIEREHADTIIGFRNL